MILAYNYSYYTESQRETIHPNSAIHHLPLVATPEGGQQTRAGGIPIPIMGARKNRARVLSATTGRIEVGRRTDLFDTYVGRGPMLPQSGPSRSRTPGYNRWISVHVQRVCPLSFTLFLDSVAMTIVEIKETERWPARKREKTTGPRRHRHRGRPSRLSFGLNGDVLISTRTRGRRPILRLTGYCQTASQK